ncbi:MAG TPA: hypothetical protein VF247_08945 [Candidatus Krumholzibacteria bacterium]
MDWLFGAPLAAARLHITEEFFLPGGFADWDRRYRPALARSITTRFHVIINALLLVLCHDNWAVRRSPARPRRSRRACRTRSFRLSCTGGRTARVSP